jgi:hypothetical protein
MDITYTLTVEQDDLPVRGNAFASGDDSEDKAVEDEILRRLDQGDDWAWAYVTVTATLDGTPQFKGQDSLGGCNYKNEADFKQPGGYYDDMVKEARHNLIQNIRRAVQDGEIAANILRELKE